MFLQNVLNILQHHWKLPLKILIILNIAWIVFLSTRLYTKKVIERKARSEDKEEISHWFDIPQLSEEGQGMLLAKKASKNVVEGIQCSRLLEGGVDITETRGNVYKQVRTKDMVAFYHLNETGNCQRFREERGYFMSYGTSEERLFPLAYSIVTYKEFHQVERLLRAIYRPQNHYCIHYDLKSDEQFKHDLEILANCFDNVFIVSEPVKVTWGKFSVLEADLHCMEDLLKRPSWKYFINLTGQEFPLKTNWEIVRILKAYRGANDIYATKRRRNKNRTLHKEPAPHNITIYKGPVHVLLSRPFVGFIFNDTKAQDFLTWVNGTKIPDETFFVSLQHNPHLGAPGAFRGTSDELEEKPSMARYKLWTPKTCEGKRVRQICIFNEKDLPRMRNAPQLFANKFHFDFGQLAYECLDELHWNKTRDEYLYGSKLDITYYEELLLVKNRVNVTWNSSLEAV